jgi:predicted GNAT family N-acyltransferase
MINLDCRIVRHGSREYEETVALRDAILRRPLDLIFAPEALGAEWSDYHIACYAYGDAHSEDSSDSLNDNPSDSLNDNREELVGCLVLTPLTDGRIKMRQVAVAEHRQGTGIGRCIVEFSENFARSHGYTLMTLNARDTAIPFYTRLGYKTYSKEFTEVGIPHFAMQKQLIISNY